MLNGHTDLNNGILKRNPTRVLNQIRFVDSLLAQHHTASILDFGCGDGEHIEILEQMGYTNITGVDYDTNQIEAAQRRSLNARLITADYSTHTDQYDMVYSFFGGFGYGWTRKIIEDIQHLHSLVKPGGILLLDLINRDFFMQQNPMVRWHFDGEELCVEHAELNLQTSILHTQRRYQAANDYPVTKAAENPSAKVFTWIQRCFTPAEIVLLFESNGFEVQGTAANETGVSPAPEHQRLLIWGKAQS